MFLCRLSVGNLILPKTVTVIITYGTLDPAIYTNIRASFVSGQGDYGMSMESAVDLFESFMDRKVDRNVLLAEPEVQDIENIDTRPPADAQKVKPVQKKSKSKEKVKKGTITWVITEKVSRSYSFENLAGGSNKQENNLNLNL